VPTFPFTLPTGGALPLWVSHWYPEKVNSLGPTTEGVLAVDPVLEEPPPELLEEVVPDEPLLDVPPEPLEEVVPDEPLLDVPLPELLEEPLPDDPECGGVNGIVPPPHPTRNRSASAKTLILSMNILVNRRSGSATTPFGQRECGSENSKIQIAVLRYIYSRRSDSISNDDSRQSN
jgi:hypothetical protein